MHTPSRALGATPVVSWRDHLIPFLLRRHIKKWTCTASLLLVIAACDNPTSPPTAPLAPETPKVAVPEAGPMSTQGPVAGSISARSPEAGPMSAESPQMEAGAGEVTTIASAATLPGWKASARAFEAAGNATTAIVAPAMQLLWQNTATGDRSIWIMNGASWDGSSYALLPSVPLAWSMAATGDFNADGNSDIVWQNTVTGDRSIWFMSNNTWGGSFALLPNVAPAWSIAGAGDFTGDGYPDLVWQNTTTGDRSIWFMNGSTWTGGFALLPNVSPDWRIAAVADMNADNKPDLIWQNIVTGQRSIWFMNGSTWGGSYALLPTVATDWRIAGAADFDGDSKPDLVWQNLTTGQRSIWIMNGATWDGTYTLLPTVSTAWSIAGTLPIIVTTQFSQQGPKLVGTGAVGTAEQGRPVALSADGNTAIVGGRADDYAFADGAAVGAAWIWTRSGGVWTQQGPKLVGSGAVGRAYQGASVSLSADGNTALIGGWNDDGDAGAAWVWTRSGEVWTQQGPKLVGSGAVGKANQGVWVSLSADGNTAIVGGPGDNSDPNDSWNIGVGAAWVWTRSGGVWTQQGPKLVGSDVVGKAYQGMSVSLSGDGNTAIIGGVYDNGAAGAAWVWTRSGGAWTQQGTKLVGSGVAGIFAEQGASVSLAADGNTAIVGGYTDNMAAGCVINCGGGAAWVWTRNGGVWTQQGPKLVGSGAVGNAFQGNSVSLSANGDKAIIGGPNDNITPGATWVWTRSGGVWTQQGTKLVGSDALGVQVLQGVSVFLSADGSTAIIGGPGDNGNRGAAWVFAAGSGNVASVATARRRKP